MKPAEKTPGVRFTKEKQAAACLWAPEAKTVSLILQDQTGIPLEKGAMGYWKVKTDRLKPGDFYRFRINNSKILPDPASLSQPEGVHGPSQALDLADFTWSDENWENPPLKDYIIYELHTGCFSPEGSFEGIKKKLDYFLELGITAIEIMPVAQFPGNRSWGYDGVFPFAVQNSYGGAEGFQDLINLCHQKGLAVILDVVYNHLGPEGNYLNEFAPYFTSKYQTPWGHAVNFDDAYCDGVRNYFIANALMWLREFHIDALRLDAVHAIKDFSPKHFLRELKEQVDQLMEETGKKHYLIVECDLNDTRFINPLEKEGYGMDAQWIDEFHHALRITSGQEKTGYYADFEGITHLAKSYRDAYVYDGQYSPHRNKFFGVKTENPAEQFIVFSQNHDQTGNRMLGERTSQLLSFEMQKLLAGAVLTAPFLPLLFMGEEYSESNPFLYFISHTDPELIEAVREGRKKEFKAFHAAGEAPDPQAQETFLNSKLQWRLTGRQPHATMLAFYKKLIQLRKTNPVLSKPDRKNLEVNADEAKKLLFLHRWHDENQVIILMNFSGKPQEFTLPERSTPWKLVLDSAAPEWNGPAGTGKKPEAGKTIQIQPESFLIYTNK